MTSPYAVGKVLISDEIDQVCPEMLKTAGLEVKLQSKWAKGELLSVIPVWLIIIKIFELSIVAERSIMQEFDALIVRSATKVTKEVIAAGKNLKLIGRAGTGVDNIDVEAATERGIIVMKLVVIWPANYLEHNGYKHFI